MLCNKEEASHALCSHSASTSHVGIIGAETVLYKFAI